MLPFSRSKFWRSPWAPRAVSLLICVGVFGAVLWLQAAGWLQRLELIVYDVMLVRAVGDLPKTPSQRVAVIGVKEEDLRDKRIQFPVSDLQMTRLLRFLLPEPGRGARAVGWTSSATSRRRTSRAMRR